MKTMNYQRVIKHGNSLAIVIPVGVCRELGIHRSDQVKLVLALKYNVRGGPAAMVLEIWPVVDNEEEIMC